MMTQGEKAQSFKGQTQKDLGSEGLEVWRTILSTHEKTRRDQIIDLFHEGIEILGIKADEIPNIERINKVLKERTGWQALFVDGFEEGNNFYPMMAERIYPIGNFIRDKNDLSYTPAPDIVHDLYGHLPLLANKDYADFCQRIGAMATEFIDRPELFVQFERFFWYTIEFALIETPQGRRIFGAGIASSLGECEYALSDKPEVVPFDVDVIRKHDYYIDDIQTKLFVLQSKEQLYESLDYLYEQVKKEA